MSNLFPVNIWGCEVRASMYFLKLGIPNKEFLPNCYWPMTHLLNNYVYQGNKNHKIITIGFKQKWISLIITFGISMPLKVHIICEHLSYYFEMTGKTFRKVSDQVVESSHHKVKSFFESHPNYNHKEKESKESGEATLAGVAHFNSINI